MTLPCGQFTVRRDLIRVRLNVETLSKTSSQEAGDQADFRLTFSEDLKQYHNNLEQAVDQNMQKVDQRVPHIE